MKKVILNLVSGVIGIISITNWVTAQSNIRISFPASVKENTTSLEDGSTAASRNTVDPSDKTEIKKMKEDLRVAKIDLRVSNHLNKNYKNISGVIWNKEEKVIVASFKMNGKSARIVYNKNGTWLYSILTYYKDQLPGHISSLVNASYPGFDIILVQEISQDDITLHKIHLEDCNKIKQVLVYDNEITVFNEFTKSK